MKNLKLLCLLLISLSFYGQIKVSSHADMPVEAFVSKISAKDMERFKESTTIFLYRNVDEKNLHEIKEIFEKNWNLTKIKFESVHNVKYEEDKFYISFVQGNIPSPSMGYSASDPRRPDSRLSYALLFWYPKIKVKRNRQRIYYKGIARVELFPSIDLVKREKTTDENEFLNWHPAFLKGYLVTMQKLILSGSAVNIFNDYEDKEQMNNLKKATLYVPEYLLKKDYRLKPTTLEKLFKDYKYPHEAIEEDNLYELIQSSKEPIYYLVVTRSGGFSVYYTIYRSDTGEMIYHNYISSKLMIKAADFELIYEAINE